MAELVCNDCGHAKRMHSIAGCTYSAKDRRQNCLCQVKFTEKENFEMGTPRND